MCKRGYAHVCLRFGSLQTWCEWNFILFEVTLNSSSSERKGKRPYKSTLLPQHLTSVTFLTISRSCDVSPTVSLSFSPSSAPKLVSFLLNGVSPKAAPQCFCVSITASLKAATETPNVSAHVVSLSLGLPCRGRRGSLCPSVQCSIARDVWHNEYRFTSGAL